jgi:hypothetical protein
MEICKTARGGRENICIVAKNPGGPWGINCQAFDPPDQSFTISNSANFR